MSKAIQQAINIADLQRLAKRRLPRIVYDFIEGGCDDEWGIDRNEAAIRRHGLIPRVLRDISRRDQSVTLFGRTYASPFGIAPTGMAGLFRPNAEAMFAEAAAAANVPYIMSVAGTRSIEDLAAIAPANLWFQAYPMNDRAIMLDQVRRAGAAGVQVLVVAVDVPVHANRERNRRNGFGFPPKMPLPLLLEALTHPAWIVEHYRNGGPPVMQTNAPYASGPTAADVARFFGTQTPSGNQVWADLEALRRAWSGPLVVKGVMHPDDAVRCRDLGADGIYVSNHGGRQLDRAPAPIEMLPVIRKAVGPDTTLLIDSGFRRGSDIVTARCLGAQAAFVGRPAVYGSVAGSGAGVAKALQILRAEVDNVMGLLGATSLADLGEDCLFNGG